MRRISLAIAAVVMSTLACTLTSGDAQPTSISAVSKPVVAISQPQQGTAYGVGDTITVQASASDPGGSGITRVELLVNNVIVDNQPSQNPLGDPSLSALLDYVAAVANPNLTLTVRAYRGVVRSDDASITVVINSGGGSSSSGSTDNTGSTGSNSGVPPAAYNPVCRARVDVKALNFREGPSVAYDVLDQFSQGDEAPLVGRLADNSWWEVTSSNLRGWVSSTFTSLLGNCDNIPVTTPPPSPVPVATSTSVPAPNTPANLVISAFNGPSSIVLLGGQGVASYIIKVKNVGGTAAGAFNVTLFYPDGRAFDYTIASLAPNEEKTAEGVGSVTFSTLGSYRLEVYVDSSNNIPESSEDDNKSFKDVVVTAPTPTP